MNAADFGLKDSELEWMLRLFARHREVEQVILFGSRACGNWRRGSDVDLALVGVNLSPKVTGKLRSALEEESPLPYFFNVLDSGDMENEELKRQVEEFGKVIYRQEETLQPAATRN